MARVGEERWRFDALTRDELNAIAGDATVVVPLGSVEQHGHHLPVRVDNAAVTAIAERAVAQASASAPILLTPTVPFGFAHHHVQFGGTISVGSLTYVSLLTDIATSLNKEGFTRLVFLNGHGGNVEAMELVADRLGYEVGLAMSVAATSYWSIGRSALEEAGLLNSLVPGHAGHFETSLLMALHPELVHLDDRPTDDEDCTPIGRGDLPAAVIRRPGMWESSDGRTDDARLASAEIGERALEVLGKASAEFLLKFHNSTRSAT